MADAADSEVDVEPRAAEAAGKMEVAVEPQVAVVEPRAAAVESQVAGEFINIVHISVNGPLMIMLV